MHTSVKSPIIHDPCVQHISHQLEPLWWNPPLWLPLLLAVHISFIFSRALFYSAFCFKAASLIILTRNVSFAWRLSLKPGIWEYEERWFVLMMGGDEGEMTKRRKMVWDRRRGGAVRRNVADEPQIMAQMKLIQPLSPLSIVYTSIRMIFVCLSSIFTAAVSCLSTYATR